MKKYFVFLILFLIPNISFGFEKTTNFDLKKLLEIQKKSMIKELLKIPKLYYAKSHFPLELSQRAFNHLWRVCESYELWCKETKQDKLILLNLAS